VAGSNPVPRSDHGQSPGLAVVLGVERQALGVELRSSIPNAQIPTPNPVALDSPPSHLHEREQRDPTAHLPDTWQPGNENTRRLASRRSATGGPGIIERTVDSRQRPAASAPIGRANQAIPSAAGP